VRVRGLVYITNCQKETEETTHTAVWGQKRREDLTGCGREWGSFIHISVQPRHTSKGEEKSPKREGRKGAGSPEILLKKRQTKEGFLEHAESMLFGYEVSAGRGI